MHVCRYKGLLVFLIERKEVVEKVAEDLQAHAMTE